MGYFDDVWAERATLLRGLTLFLGGTALVLAGSMIGLNGEKAAQIAAGTVAVTGIVAMFLGFFVYLLPPLLPSR